MNIMEFGLAAVGLRIGLITACAWGELNMILFYVMIFITSLN